jgi:hypothetical protein
MDLPNLDARVCCHCLWWEDSKEFKETCEASKDGKHRLMRSKIWFGVIADDLWGVRSAETARRAMGEVCFTENAYVLVQQFSDAEIEALRQDRAVLVLSVVPVEDL